MEDNNTKNEVNKPKIVPSYVKKNNIGDSGKNKKRLFKSRITKYIVIAIIILVLSGTLFFGYNIYLNNKYKGYTSYENNMNNYGFNLMYDSKTANTTDKVTKSEMVKVIISSILNTYDISNIWTLDDPEYENQVWVDYAEQNELIEEGYVNSQNESQKATFMEALKLLNNYKVKVLGKNVDIESTPNFSDFDKYNNEEQTIIRDMVWNKVIDDNTNKLDANRYIVKGELNELIIRFVEKYNTIVYYTEDKLNISEDKLPYNSDIYTYTLANINKKVYEAKFDYVDVSKSILPYQLYLKYKDKFEEWIVMIEEHYNTILNVDYNNFSNEEFTNRINSYVYNNYSSELIGEYEKYIKDNKVVLTGSVVVQMPIIYFDGQDIRVRVKLQFNINSADTRENLLFGDLFTSSSEYYENDSIIKYIDVKLISNSSDFNEVFIGNSTIDSLVVKEL